MPGWLLDVGSAVVKLCRTAPCGALGPTVREARRPGLAPGEQAVRLLAREGFDPSDGALRACSSAAPGPTVGVVGMTGRYSVAAAVRAAVTAGAEVAYTRALGTALDAPLPPVDVLVAVGGVDGTDHRRLDAAVRGLRLAEHPHGTLVWAGARDATAAVALRPQHRADNVVDAQLRPDCGSLTETLRRIHLSDLVDREGLGALAELVGGPIPATPDAVGEAACGLATGYGGPASERGGPASAQPAAERGGPVLVVDVGGTTTDVHLAAGPGAPVRTQVYGGLGVAGARRSLLARLADTPVLDEFVGAVAPTDRRTRYLRLREGDETALPPEHAALACVFLALRQLREEGGTGRWRGARLVVTGGAAEGLGPGRVGDVAQAACGGGELAVRVRVDSSPGLWARGLLGVGAGGA